MPKYLRLNMPFASKKIGIYENYSIKIIFNDNDKMNFISRKM
jgi:hypothetical protein